MKDAVLEWGVGVFRPRLFAVHETLPNLHSGELDFGVTHGVAGGVFGRMVRPEV